MVAPITRAWLKPISMYFPKRLLLSFLVVLAFPKAWQKGGSVFPGVPGEANPPHPSILSWAEGHGKGLGWGRTSMSGLEASTFSSMLESPRPPPTVVKYLMAYLAEAVFPAPDSPLMMRDWFLPNLEGNVGMVPMGLQPFTTTTQGVQPHVGNPQRNGSSQWGFSLFPPQPNPVGHNPGGPTPSQGPPKRSLTSPSACRPPLPTQRCGGPYPPSPGRCRRRSPHPHRWAAVCRG